MDTTPTLEAEDLARTQGKILKALEAGHGVTLEAPEVERLVAMMQGLEFVYMNERHGHQQTQGLLAAILSHLEGVDPGALSFPGQMMDNTVTGFDAAWDETEDVISFTLHRESDEPTLFDAEIVDPGPTVYDLEEDAA